MLALNWPSLAYTPVPSWGAGPRGTGMGWPGSTASVSMEEKYERNYRKKDDWVLVGVRKALSEHDAEDNKEL